MKAVLILFALQLVLVGCPHSVDERVDPRPVVTEKKVEVKEAVSKVVKDSFPAEISPIEAQLIKAGLVNIHDLDSGIVVDLRYSTTDNFIGLDMYGDFDKCYLQKEVADKLVLAQKALRTKYPFYSLVVYDATRPLHIQQQMWDTLTLPPGEKTKYLSNPGNGSLHNYGAAVDLSIIDDKGIPLDMGTPFDFFGEKAHPVKEGELLDKGILSQRQVLNRELLREVMRKSGFFGIQTEWWHFNSCTRVVAAEKYEIVK
ncbi:MAG: M15 family metallopeptidase [Bacteroidota bacterium]|nr:M15 family metallopeptidase [Bacteroidota bacterium]